MQCSILDKLIYVDQTYHPTGGVPLLDVLYVSCQDEDLAAYNDPV